MKDKVLRAALGFRQGEERYDEPELKEIFLVNQKLNLLAKELGYRFEHDWDINRVTLAKTGK